MSNVVALTQPDEAWRDSVDLATESEQGLIGFLLLYPESFPNVSGIAQAAHFVEPVHAAIFEAITSCRKAGLRGTIAEVRQALGSNLLSQELTQGMNLATYISRLMAGGATSLSGADYARSIRAHWALRSLSVATDLASGVGLPEQRVRTAFDKLDEIRVVLADDGISRKAVGSVAQAVLERASAIARGEAEEPGITTGLPDLDRAMLGFRPGEFVIVAGRPGMGKTTFGTAIALKSSDVRQTGRRAGVLYFALEMGEEAIGARCLADIAYDRFDGPTHSAIRSGQLTRLQIDLLGEAERHLNERELEIDPRPSITVGEIEATCRAVQRRMERDGHKLGVVFVDYLKQVSVGDRYRGNRVYEIGEITAGLKQIAKRLGLCVVLLTQLNRGVENREDHRPTLADLRESGDLENDADVVLLLYREAYYLKRDIRGAEPDEAATLQHKLEMVEHELEIIIAKNRNGEGEQTVRVFCDIGRSYITTMARG